jgi:hypothetical protein
MMLDGSRRGGGCVGLNLSAAHESAGIIHWRRRDSGRPGRGVCRAHLKRNGCARGRGLLATLGWRILRLMMRRRRTGHPTPLLLLLSHENLWTMPEMHQRLLLKLQHAAHHVTPQRRHATDNTTHLGIVLANERKAERERAGSDWVGGGSCCRCHSSGGSEEKIAKVVRANAAIVERGEKSGCWVNIWGPAEF